MQSQEVNDENVHRKVNELEDPPDMHEKRA